MEIVIIFISVLVYLTYLSKKSFEERVSIIRELSLALKSTTLKEYAEVIPEQTDDHIEVVKDELVDISEIDPSVLLRSLGK